MIVTGVIGCDAVPVLVSWVEINICGKFSVGNNVSASIMTEQRRNNQNSSISATFLKRGGAVLVEQAVVVASRKYSLLWYAMEEVINRQAMQRRFT